MAIVELFHKRQKRLRGEYPDVYQYDVLPDKLRVQIVHMWDETIGRDPSMYNTYLDPVQELSRSVLEQVYKILIKELGVFKLTSNEKNDSVFFEKISNYFLNETETEKSLDVVEVMMQAIILFHRNSRNKFKLVDVMDELNQRFREHGVGYQYENGQIIRTDSEFIHAEAVKPVLQLLSNPTYKGAQQEFLKAHEHYRHERYSEALIDCLKAYESTLKIILDKNKWEYSPNATADELTGRLMQSGLVPEFWQQYFKSLKNTLTSGVPTARNKLAGHGAANEVREIPEYLVSYILHMTASTIVFLIKAEETLD
ncbi:STM4504/CBY_0614 family protein [Psychrobacter alimentarius]|uniref:STM4504/CBY_0614 family protein n=1 Tax=Psychrobacter alimentarius TaxID=261164 RepID=UPI003FD495BB